MLVEGSVAVRPGFRGGRGGLWVRGATDEYLNCGWLGSDDERALSELYDRYCGLIYGAGTRYLGDRTLAENLVQDVLLAVWHQHSCLRQRTGLLCDLGNRITRNRITDLARRRRVRVRTVAPVSEEVFPDSDDGADEILRFFDVVGVLSELAPAHREVLVLAYFGGFSQREISDCTDLPPGHGQESCHCGPARRPRERLRVPKTSGDTREDDRQHEWTEDG